MTIIINNAINNTLTGVTDGSSAAAGKVGQFLSINVPVASQVLIAAADTAQNITSLVLTPGDWDVRGNLFFSTATPFGIAYAALTLTSATFPDYSLMAAIFSSADTYSQLGLTVLPQRFNVTVNTTIYLIAYVNKTGCSACGGIYARRVH